MILRNRLAEVQLAVMLLTRFPAGRIAGEAPNLAAARWAFPLVGAFIGLTTWGVHALCLMLGAPPLAAATLSLAGLVLVTGALHFDGLADYADGIGGGKDKARALEIMRDSFVGSYGVLALIIVSGVWVTSVAAFTPGPMAFIAIGMLSRAGIVMLQETLPPARDDGMGYLAAGKNYGASAVAASLGVVAFLIYPLPSLACILVIGLIGWQAQRRLGGQTGDVLGAAQLLAETAFWLALASL